jgi:hypothetical protein
VSDVRGVAVRLAVGAALTFALPLAAQDVPRLVGLVELPGLFGMVDPDGPPGATPPARVEPIPLHAEPGSVEPFRVVDAPEEIEWREHDYEAPAAMAYGARDGWVLVAARDGEVRRFGWVPPPHTGPLHSLEALLVDGLAYLTTAWNGELGEAPAEGASAPGFAASTVDDPRDVNVLEAIEREGVIWLRVALLEPGRCHGAGPVPVEATGWVPALAGDGRPNAWFYSRGC